MSPSIGTTIQPHVRCNIANNLARVRHQISQFQKHNTLSHLMLIIHNCKCDSNTWLVNSSKMFVLWHGNPTSCTNPYLCTSLMHECQKASTNISPLLCANSFQAWQEPSATWACRHAQRSSGGGWNCCRLLTCKPPSSLRPIPQWWKLDVKTSNVMHEITNMIVAVEFVIAWHCAPHKGLLVKHVNYSRRCDCAISMKLRNSTHLYCTNKADPCMFIGASCLLVWGKHNRAAIHQIHIKCTHAR